MSVLSVIGNTPLVELTNLNKNSKVRIFGKLEGSNPGGSVKDRIEATSGNTGISLAMIGVAKGYRVRLLMPECVSMERQRILEAYGAEVILTPGKEGTDGAIRRAYEILDQAPARFYMPNQYENENNVLAHYETTGPEVFSQTTGEIDVFVAGMGTGGTLMGVGIYLKEQKPKVRTVGVEPTEGHTIQGLKNMKESIAPGIYHEEELDEKIMVNDGEAFETTRLLVTK